VCPCVAAFQVARLRTMCASGARPSVKFVLLRCTIALPSSNSDPFKKQSTLSEASMEQRFASFLSPSFPLHCPSTNIFTSPPEPRTSKNHQVNKHNDNEGQKSRNKSSTPKPTPFSLYLPLLSPVTSPPTIQTFFLFSFCFCNCLSSTDLPTKDLNLPANDTIFLFLLLLRRTHMRTHTHTHTHTHTPKTQTLHQSYDHSPHNANSAQPAGKPITVEFSNKDWTRPTRREYVRTPVQSSPIMCIREIRGGKSQS